MAFPSPNCFGMRTGETMPLRHLTLAHSAQRSDTPSSTCSPKSPPLWLKAPNATGHQRSLGDKLQILALTNPDALECVERYVDLLLEP